MQKIIVKIPLITLLLGCDPSDSYLKNHEVFPYSMEIVKKRNIKLVLKKLMAYMSNIYMIGKKLRI